LFPKVLQFL